jgi:predicted amidohydrolase YtcJ
MSIDLCRWLRVLVMGLTVICSIAGSACGPKTPPAEVVFFGDFVTLDPEQPEVQGIAVREGRIVAVGSRDELADWIGPETVQHELPGVGLPGFADAHCHVESFGRQLGMLDLRGMSKEDILDHVAEAVRSAGAEEWVRGRGWDQGFWTPVQFPTAGELDAVAPENPVLLTRIDGHSAWVNSVALERAGINSETPDPEGGKIHRDAAGRPTGILVDNALDLITDIIPKPTREERESRIRAALDWYARYGVTRVHDTGVDLDGLSIYKGLLESGKLPIRVYAMARGQGEAKERYLAQGPEIELGGKLTIRCFKVLLDGALGSRGAQLGAPYADAPSETGLVLMKDDALVELLQQATERGFQVAVHAIGDLAVHRALDAFEAIGPKLREFRPRIEHVSVVEPPDISRFQPLDVIASMQPNFVGEYSRWALDRLGPDRIDWVMPTRQLLESGAVVASGTDFPASDTADPIVTLYSLVTRKGADGKPEHGLVPAERVTVDDALRTMTVGAAYSAFQEKDLGLLSVGRLADITVLSGDPRTTPEEGLRDLHVLASVVGGEIIYTES